MLNELQQTAHRLFDLGFNVTAIRAGDKRPAHTWETWQTTRQTLDDVNRLPWRDAGGVGVISGIGRLRIFDFDDCPSEAPAVEVLRALGLNEAYRWWWRSGSGAGWGIAILCDDTPLVAAELSERTNGKGPGVFKAPGRGFDHLELRWANCQTVLPPSAHPTGPGYRWVNGTPTGPPMTVKADQVVRAFKAVTVAAQPVEPPPPPKQVYGGGERPGDEFARTHTWADILEPHGWRIARERGNVTLWTRPGKDVRDGWSAATGGDYDVLWVWTTNGAPFQPERSYTKWGAYVTLNYNGDFTAAAKALYAERQKLQATTTTAAKEPTGSPAQRSARYVIHKASEAWTPRPPKTWLWEGLIGEGDLVLLVGEPGIGKTLFFLDLAVRMAQGGDFLGLGTTAGAVLVIDEESGERRLLDRLERIMRGRGIPPGAEIPLHFITMTGFNFLADPLWLGELENAITETGARLVIIDALADVMAGGDENLVRDTQPVFRGLKGVCEATGASIMVIHHVNKGGTYRGSSAMLGAVDMLLSLSRKDKNSPVVVETVKARDIEPVKLACRMLWDDLTETVHWERVDEEPETEEPLSRAEKAVLRYITERGGTALKPDIERNAGIGENTAHHALYSLTRRGLLARDETQAGRAALYRLTRAPGGGL